MHQIKHIVLTAAVIAVGQVHAALLVPRRAVGIVRHVVQRLNGPDFRTGCPVLVGYGCIDWYSALFFGVVRGVIRRNRRFLFYK
ncbi:hypothetical protein [Parabacteroides johnsonii]|uniref:hypothetical protein n=1 Tax=Parabacteroides johnsonii TaxID=387661 RepID=UPI0021CAF80B|nr:hypothetical protein [Parabacteroides johnsonii]